MNRRIFAFSLLVGLLISLVSGGFSFNSYNGATNISLPPIDLASWMLMVIATFSIDLNPPAPVPFVKAPWWKQSVAFICDFVWLFYLLFVPVALIELIIHLGHLPPPWNIADSQVKYPFIEAIIFIFPFCIFWSGMGLALHPRIRTPGMVLANIDLRLEGSNTPAKIAFFGIFAYYGVFIPLFKYFAMGLEAIGAKNSA